MNFIRPAARDTRIPLQIKQLHKFIVSQCSLLNFVHMNNTHSDFNLLFKTQQVVSLASVFRAVLSTARTENAPTRILCAKCTIKEYLATTPAGQGRMQFAPTDCICNSSTWIFLATTPAGQGRMQCAPTDLQLTT